MRPCAAYAHGLIGGICCVSLLVLAGELGAQIAESQRGGSFVARLANRFRNELVPRCLTPATGAAMGEVVASGAVKSVLGSELTLESGSVRANQIELAVRRGAAARYIVTLALPGTKEGEPDARGIRFWIYVSGAEAQDPRTHEALLAVGRIFDAAIPETAMTVCGGSDQSAEEPRYPRVVALASAVVYGLILLIAITYGLRALRVRETVQR